MRWYIHLPYYTQKNWEQKNTSRLSSTCSVAVRFETKNILKILQFWRFKIKKKAPEQKRNQEKICEELLIKNDDFIIKEI